MDIKQISNENTDILLDFVKPTQYNCRDILSSSINYKLTIAKNEFKYIVRLPESLNISYLDKISPLLQLYELDGSEDGIYTWILCDFGVINSRQIFVKQNINITEIATKHTDILKDICLNKHSIEPVSSSDPASLTHDMIIRVYFGGELSKKTERNTGHITYNLNFLSGTYSQDTIDPLHFPDQVAYELKKIFEIGICDNDVECLSKHTINILRTNDTMITSNDTIENFEEKILDTYGNSGAKIYKFDKRIETDMLDLRRTYSPISTYKSRLQMLDRQFPVKNENYYAQLDNLNKYYKPIDDDELEKYLLRIEEMESIEPMETEKLKQTMRAINSGGKKNSLKSRKYKKNQKSKKSKKSKKYKKTQSKKYKKNQKSKKYKN